MNPMPPLLSAVEAGDLETVKRLLDAGADIEERNAYRQTALHLAAGFGRGEIMALPPEPRPGDVVQGDWVEAIGLVNESSPAWLLARYVGKERTTAGLLERDALECQEGL